MATAHFADEGHVRLIKKDVLSVQAAVRRTLHVTHPSDHLCVCITKHMAVVK